MCLLARPGGGFTDLTGRARVVSTPPTWAIRKGGLSFDAWVISNASTVDLDFTAGGWAVAVYTHTSVLATAGNNPSPAGRSAYTSESVNSGWSFIQSGGAPPHFALQSFRNNAFASYALVGTSTVAIDDVFLGHTSDGSSIRRLIVNGIQEATSAVSLNPLTTTGTLQQFDAAGTGASDGAYLLLAWNRDITLAEWAWLASEPYCFLRPRMQFAPPSDQAVPYSRWNQHAPLLAM